VIDSESKPREGDKCVRLFTRPLVSDDRNIFLLLQLVHLVEKNWCRHPLVDSLVQDTEFLKCSESFRSVAVSPTT
jgi:hypothetical protein